MLDSAVLAVGAFADVPRILALMRHGRAIGPDPGSRLSPAGLADIEHLGRRLAAERWRPVAAFASPYTRARDSARLLLSHVAPELAVHERAELVPEGDEGHARALLLAECPDEGRSLVVGHLPLIALLGESLLDRPCLFAPGSFVEIELRRTDGPDDAPARPILLRRIDPGA